MFCRNCGNEVSDKAVICVACGTPPLAGDKFCYNCKADTSPDSAFCIKCGVGLKQEPVASANEVLNLGPKPESKRVAAALFAILLGPLGVHKFYLGYTVAGVIQLLITCVVGPAFTLLTCGCGIWVVLPGVYLVPFIEGIIYLSQTDAVFVETYQVKQKQWF
ncbi:MAG: domain containing protein [Bacteroidota bacterium]|nr:domain containing protein [Bacteroidota bacterium]